MSSVVAEKEILRKEAAARREDAAAGNDIGARLLACFESRIPLAANAAISGFWPINSEANILPLLRALAARGHTVALPVVPARGQPLTFRRWREADAMDTGPFGIPEPKTDAAVVLPDLVLTPLLAFDRAGYRLGYGGGYYDRTIAGLRARKPILAVGVAYAAQEYPAVPHADYDEALDWIVTEAEAFRPARGDA